MSVLAAVREGWGRALRAPVLTLGLWAVFVLVPSPVFLDPADAHAALIEASAMDPLAGLVSMLAAAPGALAHAVVVTFLLGGVLDRLARDRAVGTYGFFGAAGMYFFRFLRLDAIAIPIHLALITWLNPPLSRAGLPVWVMLAPAVAVNLIFDYARVRMVVEDRRSAIGSLAAALRFVGRNFPAAAAVSLIFAGLLAAAWTTAAGWAGSVPAIALVYALAHAVLVLAFAGSLTALFQGRLAHAGYTARRLPAWPESAAAEVIRPR
jgi:hypothetical protein